MVKKNITSLIKNQRLIFIFFTLLQTVSIIAAIYLYCDVRAYRIDLSRYDDAASLFEVSYEGGIEFATVKEAVEKVYYQKDYPVFNINIVLDEMDKITANRNFGLTRVTTGKYPENQNDILIDSFFARDNSVSLGDKVEFLNREFTVSGTVLTQTRDKAYREIAYSSIKDSDKIHKLNIKFDGLPSTSQVEGLTAYLYETFSDADITPPEPRDYLKEYGFDSRLLISFSLLILVVLNISFLYKYILLKRKDRFAIFRICGCKKSKAFFILLNEVLIYFIVDFIAALVIWYAFLKRLLIGESITLSILDTIIPSAVYLVLMLAVFIPNVMKYTAQTTVGLLHSSRG